MLDKIAMKVYNMLEWIFLSANINFKEIYYDNWYR